MLPRRKLSTLVAASACAHSGVTQFGYYFPFFLVATVAFVAIGILFAGYAFDNEKGIKDKRACFVWLCTFGFFALKLLMTVSLQPLHSIGGEVVFQW